MNAADDNRKKFKIREAESRDLDAMVEIYGQVSGEKKTRYWRNMLAHYSGQRGSGFFLVAECEQNANGFILGEIRTLEFGSPPCGWVYAIGVGQDHLHQGVGSILLEALCLHFRQAEVTRVRTMIAREDHGLLFFFRSYGVMAGPFQQP